MNLKKILILSSSGGYGHVAATNTLKALLEKEYEIETAYPISDLRIMGLSSGEGFYNYTISKSWNALTNWYTSLFSFPLFSQREKKTTALIERYLDTSRPDLLISVIPFVNYPAAEAARKRKIPFLLITLDNDLHNWVFQLEKNKHENFKVTIGSDMPSSKGLLLKAHIPEDAIKTIGFPLRLNFLNTRGKDELRREYGIAPDRKVVLITMGGVGGRSSYQYATEILQSDLNVHLIVCTGRNKKLIKKLQSLEPSNGNTLAIIPFTEKINELFALSDLVITKSGPGTINELMHLKIPMLIEHTRDPLFWEKVNIDWVEKLKVGRAVNSLKEEIDLVRLFLYDNKTRAEVAKSYDRIPPQQFAERIKLIIEELVKYSKNL